MYLAKLTTAQAKTVLQNDPIVVIPVGSTEQHGPQCALGTDFMIPSYLADRIADLDNVLVVPAVPYGVCPYHMSFAGSIDLGYEGLYTVLRSIAFSLMQHGARRFLVLNGHGGNNPSIDKMALEVYHAGGICASIDWWSLVGQLDPSLKGGHGDFLETSAMMVVDPESVHLELCQPMNAHDPSENAKAALAALPIPINYGTDELMRPEDIANVIVFLVSPLAHGINGNVMFVDGGTDALLNSEKVY